MMSKPYKEIAPISPENREAIRRKTAYSLPDEPSARGMPPDQIRKYFWSALTGDRQSLFVEIDRVAKETNAAFDALLILLFGTVNVNGESVRLAELIPTGLAGDYTLADLLAGLADGSAQELISSGVDGLSMAAYLKYLPENAGNSGNGCGGDGGGEGTPGKDGRGIVSIERTSGDGSPGTKDTYTITYTDGTTSTFTVTNGKNGKDGEPGKAGKTPVKGTDYYTPADKAEMVADVLAALPVYNGEAVEE
jgi:hypothetical protein